MKFRLLRRLSSMAFKGTGFTYFYFQKEKKVMWFGSAKKFC